MVASPSTSTVNASERLRCSATTFSVSARFEPAMNRRASRWAFQAAVPGQHSAGDALLGHEWQRTTHPAGQRFFRFLEIFPQVAGDVGRLLEQAATRR